MTWFGLLLGTLLLGSAMLVARPSPPAVAAATALVAAATAVVLSGAVVIELVTATREVAATGSRDVAPGPLPAVVVDRFRGVLDTQGGTWALTTPEGRCREHGRAFFWLAFQLLPHPADCRTPAYELYWQVPPPHGSRVAASGEGYWIVVP